jgi:hypothetical protein
MGRGIAPAERVFIFILLSSYYSVFMKKLLGIIILVVGGFIAIATNSSCSSPSSTPSTPDTIHLAFRTSPPSFTTINGIDTSQIYLTCGCPFVLNANNNGGDTSVFQIVDLDTMTTKISPHYLQIKIKPGTPSGTYNAWYAYWAVDHLGGTDRDTLQISAKF